MKSRIAGGSTSKSGPEYAEQWRTLLSDIAAKRHTLLMELEDNDARRRELACAAANGQSEALKAAAVLAERCVSIHHELALLQIAEERAQTEIARFDQEATAKSRAAAIEVQRKRLLSRSRLVATIEDRLKDLASDLGELDQLSEEVSTSYYALGGERLIVAPLARSAVGSRLSEFSFGLGLEKWLPVACAATKAPPTSFRQIEIDAQEAYQILQ